MSVMWHAGCLDMDLLRRKAHSISLFVRGHCDILPPGHFMWTWLFHENKYLAKGPLFFISSEVMTLFLLSSLGS